MVAVDLAGLVVTVAVMVVQAAAVASEVTADTLTVLLAEVAVDLVQQAVTVPQLRKARVVLVAAVMGLLAKVGMAVLLPVLLAQPVVLLAAVAAVGIILVVQVEVAWLFSNTGGNL